MDSVSMREVNRYREKMNGVKSDALIYYRVSANLKRPRPPAAAPNSIRSDGLPMLFPGRGRSPMR